MDDYVRRAMNKWKVPGLGIVVVKDGEVVVARGYGVCELESDRKVTTDSIFTIASCAKSFTAACIGMLVDEGKLDWDDLVKTHLPTFELASARLTEHITLRDLLTHRSGLCRCDLLCDRADFRTSQILQRIKYLPIDADMRTTLTYSNAMYVALGEVVTRTAGKPWQVFAAERIFRPLHMKSTTTNLTDLPADRIALRHWWSDAGIVPRPAHQTGEVIYSTANDMAKWLTLQLREGESAQGRVLRVREKIT
jgi:CubicO group peptidase (beta-lactamase class C family)